MINRHRAIRAILATLLLASTFGASGALANLRDKECVGTCRQFRRACVLKCSRDANCGMAYKVGRAQCIALTLPGDSRQTCFAHCGDLRSDCQTGLKDCKASCGEDFDACRDACGTM